MAIDIASPIPHCGHCNSNKGKLLKCSRCSVVHYCNKEHQAAHFKAHKSLCRQVQNTLVTMQAEEQQLNELPSDFGFEEKPFENSVGHFWGILETRDYMRARLAYAEALRNIHTHDSVKTQVEHLRDMLRLCRSDNIGVRDLLPAMLLRLDRDQECYDFMKWYATVGQEGDYDWGDMDLGFLDVKDANVFESVEPFVNKYSDLCFVVNITLLKIKLLIDIQNLSRSVEENSKKVPNEVLDLIQTNVVRSPILKTKTNRHILESKDNSKLIEQLKQQIKFLYKATEKNNVHFWPVLLKPGKYLTAAPSAYTYGSPEQMQLALQYTYYAWAETKGALEVVRELRDGKF